MKKIFTNLRNLKKEKQKEKLKKLEVLKNKPVDVTNDSFKNLGKYCRDSGAV